MPGWLRKIDLTLSKESNMQKPEKEIRFLRDFRKRQTWDWKKEAQVSTLEKTLILTLPLSCWVIRTSNDLSDYWLSYVSNNYVWILGNTDWWSGITFEESFLFFFFFPPWCLKDFESKSLKKAFIHSPLPPELRSSILCSSYSVHLLCPWQNLNLKPLYLSFYCLYFLLKNSISLYA